MTLRTKRAYEPADAADGARYLIDRLWPRGIRSVDLRLTAWRKELAPSDELRRFFQHDPARFEEFRARYLEELEPHGAALDRLRDEARTGNVTLVYAARDGLRCNAGVLAELISAPRPKTSPASEKNLARTRAAGPRTAVPADSSVGSRAKTSRPSLRTAPRHPHRRRPPST